MAPGRKKRRCLLFVVTLITILLVIFGAVSPGTILEGSPLIFAIFWAVCFICAMVVICFAFIDMRMTWQEHRVRQVELDAELALIVSDAKELAAANQESETND